jgi:hypothetical protein
MARRGRPKSQREAIDRGTPELQAKRRAAAGQRGDLAAEPLGILHARGLLDGESYAAGVLYAWLFGRVIRRPTLIARQFVQMLEDGATMDARLDNIESGAEEQFWRRAVARLHAAGAGVKESVDRVAVYRQPPRNDARDMLRIRSGLAGLAALFTRNRRGEVRESEVAKKTTARRPLETAGCRNASLSAYRPEATSSSVSFSSSSSLSLSSLS